MDGAGSNAGGGGGGSTGSGGDATLGSYAGSSGIATTVVVVGVLYLATWILHSNTLTKRIFGVCCPCLFWPHWPISFISNTRDNIAAGTHPREFWAFDVLDPEHLVTSFCFPTWVLLLLHIICFLYFVAYVLLDVLLYYPKPGSTENPYWQWLTYLTNWSIMFYALASFIAALNTVRYMRFKRRLGHATVPRGVVNTNGHEMYPAGAVSHTPHAPHTPDRVAAAERVPHFTWDFLSIAHLLLMELFTTAAFFVGVWYWAGVVGIVGSASELNEATTYMPHGGSALLGALQVIFTRMPIVSHHFPVLATYGVLYMIFLWIYGSVTGIWRYSLDWHYWKPVAALILILPILFIMFSIWYFLAKFRFWCCLGRHPKGLPPVKYDDNGMPPTSHNYPAGVTDMEMQQPAYTVHQPAQYITR